MIKIPYSSAILKQAKKGALFFMISSLVIAGVEIILSFYYEDVRVSTGPSFFFVSLLQYGYYLYQKKKGYLSIEMGVLSKHQYFKKSIPIKEINFIRKFAGEFQVKRKKGDKIDLLIDYNQISPEDLVTLIEELEKYEIEWA